MRIELKEAVPGMILDAEIMWRDTILVNKGREITAPLINKLKNFGITHIDVVSEQKDEIIEDTVSQELCNKVKESLMTNNIPQLEEITTEMIASVLKSMDIDGGFSNLKYDLQIFNSLNSLDHSVRTAIFSTVLACLYNDKLKKIPIKGNKNLIDVKDVTLAALLHDRGRNNYNPDVLNTVKEMTDSDELKEKFPGLADMPTDKYDDRYISIYSYCLIQKIPELSDQVKFMVLYSSETENNRGPLKFTKFNANTSENIGAKIIHIASLYDNFLAHLYHTGESFEDIITVLGQAISTESVNEELASLFMKKVPIYPLGAKLELSNGEKAVVIKTFTEYTYITRPIVKLLSTGERINLKYKTDLTIKCVIKEEASLEQVVDSQVSEVSKARR